MGVRSRHRDESRCRLGSLLWLTSSADEEGAVEGIREWRCQGLTPWSIRQRAVHCDFVSTRARSITGGSYCTSTDMSTVYLMLTMDPQLNERSPTGAHSSSSVTKQRDLVTSDAICHVLPPTKLTKRHDIQQRGPAQGMVNAEIAAKNPTPKPKHPTLTERTSSLAAPPCWLGKYGDGMGPDAPVPPVMSGVV